MGSRLTAPLGGGGPITIKKMYNKESGYGKFLPLLLPSYGAGKIRVVGASTVANRQMCEEVFGVDPDGEARFFATIDAAVSACTADAGDVVFVLPGHTETIAGAAGIAMDVAGVSVIGLGRGTLKPTLTFSATASDINVSAANCLIKNLRCVSGVNDLGNFIDADAGQLTIEDCDFVTGSATEALNFINLATTKDDFIIRGCTFLQPTDPAGTNAAVNTGAIYLVDTENVLVENCVFRGQFESGIIHNKTTACKGLVVKNCELSNELTVPFLLVTTAEGVCERCYGATLTASDASEAQVFGTIGTLFWISQSTSLGNDSGGGGQGSITGTVAS